MWGGYQRQARAVGAATAAVVWRLALENRSAVVEGVHMLPGQLREGLVDHPADPVVVELLLKLADENLHRAHFAHRVTGEPARGGQRHLENFALIRDLQAGLIASAESAGVNTYDIAHPEHLTQCIVDHVVEQTKTPAAHRRARAATSACG
jgi:2-phosphoglycerate kinase